jgi:aminopeptidase N
MQEGFAGLGEELVIADLCGKQAGAEFLSGRFRTIENDKPIIPRYGINEDGSNDNYIKGWAIIHMIRTIINDDTKFQTILRGLTNNFFHKSVTTKQIEDYISLKSGIDFKNLFDQYLRTAKVPVLEYKLKDKELMYKFGNCNENFSMPIKTNLTKEDWIYPKTIWQSLKNENFNLTDTLKADINFYITVKKVE